MVPSHNGSRLRAKGTDQPRGPFRRAVPVSGADLDRRRNPRLVDLLIKDEQREVFLWKGASSW